MVIFPAMYTTVYWANPDRRLTAEGLAAECFVLEDDTTCHSEDPTGEGVNATERFNHLLLAGCLLQLSALGAILFSIMTTKGLSYYGLASGLFLSVIGGLTWIVVLSVYRFNHVGRVVSGDLCAESSSCLPDDMQGYMPTAGRFFKIWLIVVYSTFATVLCLFFYMKLMDWAVINWHLPRAYFEKYERTEVLGTGNCAIVWKVRKRNPGPGEPEFYAAKEFK